MGEIAAGLLGLIIGGTIGVMVMGLLCARSEHRDSVVIDLPPWREPCAKCGYSPGQPGEFPPSHHPLYDAATSKLSVTCARCRYTWSVATLDSRKPTLPPNRLYRNDTFVSFDEPGV